MSPKNSRTKWIKPIEKTEKGGTGGGGQGGHNKDGNPLGTPAEQDYEHGKGFPKRKT